ncbi:glutathione S-transferase N-terminal domain-containing protein [Oleiagrimonas sp. C23AA]|uniref:glutathione S-transferase family protein n=1 Tax=Oleiagrimonas sp. C23AA TaxID=2719047 RepID=UPI00141EA72B|nr:glutathione S-transferase N-terminal domain-containing protein [Oleiagrimonas sp. C23AA]NII10345.1 glutathione S-transferase [Oleiagrimonas sp. C23AA]
MQLYVSPTSPFARKVRVALIEKGLLDQVELVPVDPWASPDALLAVNPLSQVPTLVTDNGLAVANADTIIDYLERHHPQPRLVPADHAQRDAVLAGAAQAQGAIEFTVDIVIERRKDEAQRGHAMIERRLITLNRLLAHWERHFHRDIKHFMLDSIGVACALGYLDLRLPELEWRSQAPALADWQGWAEARASMHETTPPVT